MSYKNKEWLKKQCKKERRIYDIAQECKVSEEAIHYWLKKFEINYNKKKNRCKTCKQMFIPRNYKQLFCSDKCREEKRKKKKGVRYYQKEVFRLKEKIKILEKELKRVSRKVIIVRGDEK